MNKEKKLNTIMQLLDSLAKLDNWFWINNLKLREIYISISKIDNETEFNNAYKLLLAEISSIFDKLKDTNNRIEKIELSNEEKIDKLNDNKELNILEKIL